MQRILYTFKKKIFFQYRIHSSSRILGWMVLGGLILLSLSPVFGQESPAASSPEKKDLDFADGLYQRGMYDGAAQKYEEFLKKYPASSYRETALFRQGESFYQQATKKLADKPVESKLAMIKSRSIFQEWLRTFPQGKRLQEALLRHGELSYKLNDAKNGLPSLQRVIQESKDSALLEAALFYAARCNDDLGQDDDALSRYGQILSTYPKGEFTAFSKYLMADVLARKGEREKAVQQLNDLWQHPDQYKIPEGSNLITDSQLHAAQLLYQLERFDEASKAYMAYVKDHPTGDAAVKAKYGAAWAEYRNKNYSGALEIARTLQRETLSPDLLSGILFLKGTCSYQQKSYDEAILFFREVIADPNAGDYRSRAWFQLAWSYYLSGKYEDAENECQNLLKQNVDPSTSGNVHFLLGQSKAQKKDYTAAIAELDTTLKIDPKGEYAEEAQYLMSDLLYRTEKYPQAAEQFGKFFDAYPTSSRAKDALIWAANSWFAAKEYEKAIALADRLLKAYPDLETKPDVLYRKALAQYQIKQFDAALATLDEILKSSQAEERKPEALYWTAYIHETRNEKKEAAETYQKLLDAYPSFKDREEVQLRKALCDYALKEYGTAFDSFYAILFTERGSKLPPEILFWMILTADEKGSHEEALKIAQQILTLFQDSAIRERARVAVGNQLVALKRWKELLDNADSFQKEYPDSLFQPEIFWSRAKALEAGNENDKALEWYEKSLLELQKLGDPDPTFEATLYMDRGRLLERMNRTNDALESFLRVAIIYDHPELTPEALYRSIHCHRILKEMDDADTLYAELQERYPQSSWAQKAKTERQTPSAPAGEPGAATGS